MVIYERVTRSSVRYLVESGTPLIYVLRMLLDHAHDHSPGTVICFASQASPNAHVFEREPEKLVDFYLREARTGICITDSVNDCLSRFSSYTYVTVLFQDGTLHVYNRGRLWEVRKLDLSKLREQAHGEPLQRQDGSQAQQHQLQEIDTSGVPEPVITYREEQEQVTIARAVEEATQQEEQTLELMLRLGELLGQPIVLEIPRVKSTSELEKILENVPDSPCIYIMKCSDLTLYVGRAEKCRYRLRRHFLHNSPTASSLREKIAKMFGTDTTHAAKILTNLVDRIIIYILDIEKLLHEIETRTIMTLKPLLNEKNNIKTRGE